MNSFDNQNTQPENPPETLGSRLAATTVTPEEIEEITRLHLERENNRETRTTTLDVAEALRIPPSEVEQMLAEIRSRQEVVVTPQVVPARKPIIVAAILAAFFLMLSMLLMSQMVAAPRAVPPVPAPMGLEVGKSSDAR